MKQDFTLTDDQKEAFENIKEWLKGDSRFYTLAGLSGAGKTTLMDIITDYAREKGLECRLTATTNKAVKVLMELIDHDEFSTIHSLLNIKAKKKGTKEIFEAVWKKEHDINAYDLVIVDECSMVSEKLLKEIQKQAVSGVKILFVGDPAQLQPINETISTTFNYDSSMLTEVVRHGDTIAHTSRKVRSTANFIPFGELLSPPEIDNIMNDEMHEYFEGFRDDPDRARMLCWTNNKVHHWNRVLREVDYGETHLPRFIKGDIVMANAPCEVNDQLVMLNSEEGEIKRVTEDEEGYNLTVRLFSGGEARVTVIKDDYVPEFKRKLKEYADRQAWTSYWNLKKRFHDIRHCYALTTHKSQGSSYDVSILDTKDISKNPDLEERNQLVYVAMTRARDKVKFYNGF